MDDTRTLYEPDDEVEARAFESALTEEGIACSLRPRGDTAYPGVADRSAGWGEILVDATDLERAQHVVADWLEAEAAEPELGPYRERADGLDALAAEHCDRTTALERAVKKGVVRLFFSLVLILSLAANFYYVTRDHIAPGEYEGRDSAGRLVYEMRYEEHEQHPRWTTEFDVHGDRTWEHYDRDGDGRRERGVAFGPDGLRSTYFDADEDGWNERSTVERGENVLAEWRDRDGDHILEHVRLGTGTEALDLTGDGFPDRVDCRTPEGARRTIDLVTCAIAE